MHGPSEKLLTRRDLASYLAERGFPISVSTLAKMAMPSSGRQGPPIEAAWGNRFLYDPGKALKWAKTRFGDVAALSARASAQARGESARPHRPRART
jgi:hypothetical protein